MQGGCGSSCWRTRAWERWRSRPGPARRSRRSGAGSGGSWRRGWTACSATRPASRSSVPIVLQIPPGMSGRFCGLQPPAEAPERAARRGEAGGPVRIFRFVDDDVESTRPRPGTGPAMREAWEGSGNPGRRRRGLEQARGEDCPRFPCFPHSCGAADPERHAASFRSSALLLSRRSSMSR